MKSMIWTAHSCLSLTLRCIAPVIVFCLPTPSLLAMTTQVAFFNGFQLFPTDNTGMDVLNQYLAGSEIPNYLGRVFEYDERQQAFDWIQQNAADQGTLVLIGHSFGGNTTLQVAGSYLQPVGGTVDLTVQIDPVFNGGAGANNVLPLNVEVGLNYYQIATGFLEPQGEDFVQGATNINVEELFNDTSITHTSIDNDTRLHALIAQNILDNLNVVPVENADFDQDGIVAGDDFLIWQRGFAAPGSLATGDANGDMQVNSADLAIWKEQYGSSVPPAAFHAVPEPAGDWLLTICSIVVLVERRSNSANRSAVA